MAGYWPSSFTFNHNYNKILKSDCLSPVLISALMGQCNRTVHATARVLLNGLFFTDRKNLSEVLVFN